MFLAKFDHINGSCDSNRLNKRGRQNIQLQRTMRVYIMFARKLMLISVFIGFICLDYDCSQCDYLLYLTPPTIFYLTEIITFLPLSLFNQLAQQMKQYTIHVINKLFPTD